MPKATAPNDQPRNQGEAPRKSLSLLAQEEFGDAYHGDVTQTPKTPPESDEPAPEPSPDLPEIPDEDLDEGGENRKIEGDEVEFDAPKPEAAEADSEPIATAKELLEHLEADPVWFEGLKFDVVVDDETSQVPLKDLVANYQADHAAENRLERAKTKLAQAQEEIEQRNAATDLQFQQAAKLVGVIEQQLNADVAAINWDQLRREDPAEWSAQRMRLGERQQQIQQLKKQTFDEYQQAQRAQQQDVALKRDQVFYEQSQQLMEAMPRVSPDWGNPQKVPEVKTRLATYLVGQGFAQEEVASTLDHRALVIAEKARLWDESQNKVQLTKKRIQTVPRVMKPGARKEPAAVNLEKIREAQKRLKATGHPDDALALYRAKQVRS